MKNPTTPSSLDTLLIEALASGTPPEVPAPEIASRIRERLFQHVHAPVPDYLFVHSHQGEWVALMRGIELKLLREDDHSRSFLMRMSPGSRLPPHQHALDEEALVLEGDVTINGVLCRTGDYHMAPQGKSHDWLTSENGCLLFIRGASPHRARA